VALGGGARRRKRLGGGFGEAGAEVGAEEVGLAVGGGGLEVEDGVVEGGEVALELGGVERLVDGVAGEGVGEAEVEELARGEGAPCSSQGDTRGGDGAEGVPGVGGEIGGGHGWERV